MPASVVMTVFSLFERICRYFVPVKTKLAGIHFLKTGKV